MVSGICSTPAISWTARVACAAGTALMVDRLQGMTKLAGRESRIARSNGSGFKRTALCTMESMIGTETQRPPTCRSLLLLLQWWALGDQNYGVDYGVADSVLGYSDAGNEAGPRACCHSVVFWVPVTTVSFSAGWSDRVHCLPCLGHEHGGAADVLGQTIWMPDGPRCSGPTWTPQPIVTILVETDCRFEARHIPLTVDPLDLNG